MQNVSDKTDKGLFKKSQNSILRKQRTHNFKIGQKIWTDTSPKKDTQVANKHMKRSSISLFIKEMLIKNIMR